MKSFQVVRTHLSPYQHVDFTLWEKQVVEKFPGITYQDLNSVDVKKEIILLTNTHTRLSELPPELLKATRLIIHPNSGYDHFVEDHNLWKDIPVVIGHEIRAQAVAEYSLGCLFEWMLDLPQHLSWHKERKWGRTLLQGQHVAVFGYGHIGRIVADTLAVLGMLVTVIDPFIQECPHPLFRKWAEVDMKKMNAIISCMSLNSTSREIFNTEFFRNLGEKVLFINGARGALVNEAALREYLLSHPESFAFLDVFQNEPFVEEWHHFPQVWKTSHIAGVHEQLDQGILAFEKKVLGDFLVLPQNEFNQNYQYELLQNKWIQGELI